jgi:hypothetical protein
MCAEAIFEKLCTVAKYFTWVSSHWYVIVDN